MSSFVPGSKVAVRGIFIMGIHFYYLVDDHPLPYGNNGSLDGKFAQQSKTLDLALSTGGRVKASKEVPLRVPQNKSTKIKLNQKGVKIMNSMTSVGKRRIREHSFVPTMIFKKPTIICKPSTRRNLDPICHIN